MHIFKTKVQVVDKLKKKIVGEENSIHPYRKNMLFIQN